MTLSLDFAGRTYSITFHTDKVTPYYLAEWHGYSMEGATPELAAENCHNAIEADVNTNWE